MPSLRLKMGRMVTSDDGPDDLIIDLQDKFDYKINFLNHTIRNETKNASTSPPPTEITAPSLGPVIKKTI